MEATLPAAPHEEFDDKEVMANDIPPPPKEVPTAREIARCIVCRELIDDHDWKPEDAWADHPHIDDENECAG